MPNVVLTAPATLLPHLRWLIKYIIKMELEEFIVFNLLHIFFSFWR